MNEGDHDFSLSVEKVSAFAVSTTSRNPLQFYDAQGANASVEPDGSVVVKYHDVLSRLDKLIVVEPDGSLHLGVLVMLRVDRKPVAKS